MSYLDQIEQYVAYYPTTTSAHVPSWSGVTSLPAYPTVTVVQWEEDFCELEDAGGNDLARFKLVG